MIAATELGPTSGWPHEPPVDPASVGFDPERLEKVVARFRGQCARGVFPGGQIVIRRRGKLVVDEAVGLARGFDPAEGTPPQPATPTTRFPAFSITKTALGVAMAILEDQGLLDPHSTVAKVWPEFGQNGKGGITVDDVLSHRAGVITPALDREPLRWLDPEDCARTLEQATPMFPPGKLAYSPLEIGWILDEVCRRVTGVDLARFVDQAIAVPAGLPDLRYSYGPNESPALSYWLGADPVIEAGIDFRKLFIEVAADERLRSWPLPAGGIYADAASLAAFHEVLLCGGLAPNGRRLVRAHVLARYTELACFGWDRTNKLPLAVGRGFFHGILGPSIFGWFGNQGCFGHLGLFCSLVFADRRTGVCAAFVTAGNRGVLDAFFRFAPLAHGVRRAAR